MPRLGLGEGRLVEAEAPGEGDGLLEHGDVRGGHRQLLGGWGGVWVVGWVGGGWVGQRWWGWGGCGVGLRRWEIPFGRRETTAGNNDLSCERDKSLGPGRPQACQAPVAYLGKRGWLQLGLRWGGLSPWTQS